MGAAVGRQAEAGGATVRWVRHGRSAATRQRARDNGFQEFDDLPAALDGTDVVLSICPPEFAEDVAGQVAHSALRYTGVYVEANAIAAQRTRRIAELLPHAKVVDGGIIGEAPVRAGTTRLYLSGDPHGVPGLFAGSTLQVVALPGGIGAASALKMAYASYQKASRILAAVAHALAVEHGVDAHLMREAELLQSFPLADVDQVPAVAAKAWRWAPEMREAAAMLRDAGLPDDLALGAAAALDRWTCAKDRDDLDVAAVLRLLATAASRRDGESGTARSSE